MAKGKDETAVAARPTFEVATEMPDFMRDVHGNVGMEHVRQEDMKIPRLCVAQKMSPELDKDRPEYLDGLEAGLLFNNVTRLIIGPGPIHVTPIKLFDSRIKFREGGGIDCISRNGRDGGDITPEGCHLCQYSRFHDGEPPECDELKNLLVYVHDAPSDDPLEKVAVISLKSKGLKCSKKWLGLMNGRNKPIFYGVYRLKVYRDNDPKGVSYQLDVDNAGWVRDKALLDWLEEQFKLFQSKEVDYQAQESAKVASDEVPF